MTLLKLNIFKTPFTSLLQILLPFTMKFTAALLLALVAVTSAFQPTPVQSFSVRRAPCQHRVPAPDAYPKSYQIPLPFRSAPAPSPSTTSPRRARAAWPTPATRSRSSTTVTRGSRSRRRRPSRSTSSSARNRRGLASYPPLAAVSASRHCAASGYIVLRERARARCP